MLLKYFVEKYLDEIRKGPLITNQSLRCDLLLNGIDVSEKEVLEEKEDEERQTFKDSI